MKFIPILLLFTAPCFAIVIPDTTINGTLNGNGGVVRFEGLVKGNCTVINALIELNPFVWVFDTTVTIGSGCRVRELSIMNFGAKESIIDNYNYIQNAINTCLNKFDLYVPYGVFRHASPLLSAKKIGSVWQQCSLTLTGEGTVWSEKSILQYTGVDSFAFGMQLNKGSKIKGVSFRGGWVSPTGGTKAYYQLSIANYTNQGPSGNGEGIYIDPYGSYQQRAGSTGCVFEEIVISNFRTLVKIGNGIGQNCDILLFKNIQLGDGRVGFMGTQPQEKGNRIDGLYCWSQIHTLFSTGGSGGNYYISNGNIAGSCIRLFNVFAGDWFPVHISNIYAENIGTIGTLQSTNMPLSVENSIFHFADTTISGKMELLNSNTNNLIFKNDQFKYYGYTYDMLFNGNVTFDNYKFSGNITGSGAKITIDYINGAQVVNNKNVIVMPDTTKSPTQARWSIIKTEP